MIRLCLTLFALVVSGSIHANVPGLTVNGTTISWTDSGGWIQVQDTSDYQTVCEGQISSCAVSAGTYQVIDHSNNVKSENVVVRNAAAPMPMTGMMVNILRLECNVFDDGFGSADTCELSCPSSDLALSVTCAASAEGRNQNILPSAGETYANHAICTVNPSNAGLSQAVVKMQIACAVGAGGVD